MTDGILFLSDIAAGCVRMLVCQLLMCRLFSAGKPEKKEVWAGISGMVIFSVLLSLWHLPELYRLALETAGMAFCARRLQKADIRMSLFVGIFYEIAAAFWQFLFAAWLGVFFSSPSFLDKRTESGQAAVWLLHMLLVIFAFGIWKSFGQSGHPKKEDGVKKGASRLVSFLVLAGFFAVVTLSEQDVPALSEDTLDTWTMLSVVLMMSVLVFHMKRQYEAEKELAALKFQQAELLERDYTALNSAYAVHAKLFHDFHNHIGALRQLLSHEKYEKAIQYLDELQTPVQEITDTIWTGDETADYLINRKAAAAAAGGTAFGIQVEFPRHTNIRSADLCAILGNLLDNALEAAEQVQEPEKRWVRLTIRRINQMLVIKVENSFSVPPVEENGGLKTKKEENGLHGWGLKSARTAAGKYDGMVRTSYTDCTFLAVATLSYEGVSME